MRLRSQGGPTRWAQIETLTQKLAHLVPAGDRDQLSYFLYLSSGNKNTLRRGQSFGEVLASVDSQAESPNIVWETPSGTRVISRKALKRTATDLIRLAAGRPVDRPEGAVLSVAEAVMHARTAKKVDYPKDFKEALSFLEKEIKKLQKEMFEGAPYEQIFAQAYENLVDITPDFCAVWDRFALAKGLKNRGWNIRAEVEEPVAEEQISPVSQDKEARSPYQDLALDLQGMLGHKLGGHDFTEMSETARGCISLFYGKQAEGPPGIEYHLWYGPSGPAPTGSALDVVVLANGEEVARFSEDNEYLIQDLFHRVVSDSQQRWLEARTAAQFPMQDEVDHSLPRALLPDRRGWHQMLHQVYLATRDYLRHEVPFFPERMFLLGERWNGDSIEYTMRGDKANTAVFVRGSLNLTESPVLSLEATYEKDGNGWTTVTPFLLGQYEKASDLVRDVQTHLAGDLQKGLKRLSECPSTTDQILQRVLTADLLR